LPETAPGTLFLLVGTVFDAYLNEAEDGHVPKRKTPTEKVPIRIVSFDFQDRTYQIDPARRKVYRKFVEIETSKAFEIFTVWRGQNVGA